MKRLALAILLIANRCPVPRETSASSDDIGKIKVLNEENVEPFIEKNIEIKTIERKRSESESTSESSLESSTDSSSSLSHNSIPTFKKQLKFLSKELKSLEFKNNETYSEVSSFIKYLKKQNKIKRSGFEGFLKAPKISDKNINSIDENGFAFIHRLLLHSNNHEVINYWIDKRNFLSMDINIESRCGITPLSIALFYDDVDTVRSLLHAGAELDNKLYNGVSLLHMAADSNDSEAIELLLKSDKEKILDFNIKDENGDTPLEIAKKNKNKEIVGALSLSEDEYEKSRATIFFNKLPTGYRNCEFLRIRDFYILCTLIYYYLIFNSILIF